MKRILVIEDQTSIREIVSDLLREFELADTVAEADSIEQARQLLADACWDAIITDMSLSDGNILDLIESMQLQGYAFPPILLMSGFLYGESELRARKTGIRHILSKPFVPSKLIDCVQLMLESGRHAK
ncbi:response regulator [Mariprofundus ferrooxydans]|uniref:Helix-turn-helix, Fis-type n=1 Tax=Mariprofundus ferrooxydans PV-1 TaxID=314345 RepID=Q0F3J0_9PROT|nr:response regulator [Mariprofundus ferrooxydans]EAU55951.1 Helix-turn-helix, Fis-type [Mariprofundus ferrooxydans PV-1]KON48225.1 Fis family transcriptional regulator [Mariprofundus ferrooxydans]